MEFRSIDLVPARLPERLRVIVQSETRSYLLFRALPDLAEDLAANTELASPLAGHNSLRGGQNGDAHASQDPRDILLVGINSPSGAADPHQSGDDRAAFHGARPHTSTLAARMRSNAFSPSPTSKPSMKPSSLRIRAIFSLQRGARYSHLGLARGHRITNARQHISNRIIHAHSLPPGGLPG